MNKVHGGRLPLPDDPRCEALSEAGEPCNRRAVVIGAKGEVSTFLCNDDANRAMRYGWSIGSLPVDEQDE